MELKALQTVSPMRFGAFTAMTMLFPAVDEDILLCVLEEHGYDIEKSWYLRFVQVVSRP